MNEEIKSTINKVKQSRNISLEQLKLLLEINDDEDVRFIREEAVKVCQKTYGNQVLIRGLIEFTNFCKNDCYYCGIRRSNSQADRYRLTKEQMLDCCASGYELGFRTFVLQGGEDGYFTDDKICDLVSAIKEKYPDCAVTLSIGEKSKESYQTYFNAGAERYLLRHETAEPEHYQKLHPDSMSLENRKRCLFDLKEIGYQVGSGFMVGSLNKIWPWKITDTELINGVPFDIEKNVLPGTFEQATGSDPLIWQAILMCIIGILLIWGVEKLAVVLKK